MGSRVKVFESTGLAPNGRLYAGDLNAIQDFKADQSNFAQQIDLNVVSIGESTLKLLRYAVGEGRFTGALRIDGVFRGLGGLFAGTYTTTQRDAIPAGQRPYGLIILNTTTNRFEWNKGTDAVPDWQPISDVNGDVPVGTTIEWPWSHTQLPANYLLAYGQAVLKTDYPVLNAIASASGYPHGSTGTTFNLPDLRGRVSAGRDDMGGTAANRITSGASGIPGATLGASGGVETIALTSGQIAAHAHGATALTVTGAPALTGSPTLSGTPALTGAPSLNDPQHSHGVTDPTHRHPGVTTSNIVTTGGAGNPTVGEGGSTGYAATGISINGASTGITVGVGSLSVNAGTLAANIGSLAANAGSLDVGGSTDSAGSGQAHQNVQPTIIVNKALRVA